MKLLAALAALPAALWCYRIFGEWRDRRRYPPPGVITAAGLHVWRSGSGGASVVLEAGIAGTSLGWKRVQDLLAPYAAVYSYDRAGLGWSAPASTPRTLDNLAQELHAAAIAAAIPAPYILAGHSFGGLLAQHYAALYPEEVRALVLVDPVPARDWHPLTAPQAARLQRGVSLSRRGAWLAASGIVRIALDLLASGSRAIPKLMARATAGNGASLTARLTGEVRKLPPEVWPMVRAHWCLPKSFRAMAAHLEALPANVAAARFPTGVPTIVLTPTHFRCEIPAGAEHRIAHHSGHWIQLDEPELVARAIRDLMIP